MGCGQSKIGIIYSKNKKNKRKNVKKNSDSTRAISIDKKNGNNKTCKTNDNGIEANCNENQTGLIDNKNLAKKKYNGSGNGPLLYQAEVSSSQVDFFRMLDEKIENGPDYDESVVATIKAEHVRNLLHHWELPGMTRSYITNLNNTNPIVTETLINTNSYDREGLKNIAGGRHEIAPIFTRNANRVDGLQDINCPSTNISRHVLDPITQSPIHNLKKLPLSSASLKLNQYSDYIRNNNSTMININGENHQSKQNINDDEDYITSKAFYCEQYLEQTGITSLQTQHQTGNIILHNPYVKNFQITNDQQHFQVSDKHNFNVIQMT